MKKFFTLIILLSQIHLSLSQNNLFSDVFAPNDLGVLDSNNVTFTQTFSASPSFFSSFNQYPETTVWNAEFTYYNTNANQSYTLRIGKGGQIYSLRSAFGESVPPQHDNIASSNNGYNVRPFIDEVWQMVAVDSDKNSPSTGDRYFIHQAGVYVNTSQGLTEPFYSPKVAEYYDVIDKSYTIINWGQQAHLANNADVLFTADVLFYSKFTNIGEGIIQVDNMMYNFGSDTMSHLNVPWGGVRNSTLGNFFVSNTDNTYTARVGQWGATTPRINVEETGGWSAFSTNATGTGPSLGQVFSNDESVANGIINWGRVGGVSNPRDYFVSAMIKQPFDDLDFGEALRFRYYYVIGGSIEDIKSKISEYSLTTRTLDQAGSIPTKNDVDDLYYNITKSETVIAATNTNSNSNSNYALKAQPYVNSYPLFLITGADGSTRITTDLYTYSQLPFDGETTDWKLLGYLDTKTEVERVYVSINEGENYMFTDGHVETNIIEDMVYTSNVTSDNFNMVTITSVSVTNSLGLDESDLEKDVDVFTNPKNSKLTIVLNNSKGAQFSIYNLSGQVQQSGLLTKELNKIDVNNLSVGVYIVKVIYDQQVFYKKVIKN